jgi:hypothetical protein
MAYIGKQPVVGNFQKCDAISVVNGQAAYSLTVGSAAVTPENANHMLVSLKIADDAVESEHLNNNIISGQTALAETPADTDELLLSDGGTLKRIDFSHIKGGGMYEFISQTTVSSNTTNVDITSLSSDFEDFLFSIQGLRLQNDGEKLYMQIEQAGSFITSGNYYTFGGRGFGDSSGAQTTLDSSSANYIEIQPNIGNGTNESYCGEVIVYNAQNTNLDPIVRFIGGAVDANRAMGSFEGAGSLQSTGRTTGVRFSAVNGDIASAKIAVYGRKRA